MNHYRQCLFVISFICFVLSIIHIPWLWSLQEYEVINPTNEAQLLSFQLFSMAVIMFLAQMGASALLLAKTENLPSVVLKGFTTILLVFFSCRLIVEFIFPLQIPLLGVDEPTSMVKVLLCVPVLVLIYPYVMTNKTVEK